jgi:hypothetical protein
MLLIIFRPNQFYSAVPSADPVLRLRLIWCAALVFMLKLYDAAFTALVADPPVRIRIYSNNFFNLLVNLSFVYGSEVADPV